MYYIHVTGLRTSILDHNLLSRAFILIALDDYFLDCVDLVNENDYLLFVKLLTFISLQLLGL